MEQNKDINQGVNNVSENPYTQYYQQYIAKPVTAEKKPVSPKQIISMILCIVSSLFIFIFALIWIFILIAGGSAGTENVRFTIYFLSIISLGPAIAAKVLNRKSKWALINIICFCVLFVAVIVMNLVMQ